MKVQILCDNRNSWIIPYSVSLVEELSRRGFEASLIYDQNLVEKGDILVLLSCEHIFRKLDLNLYNLVIHESALPSGKGWSPLTWQVLEGKDRIAVTLFEASNNVDSGRIYDQVFIELDGTELIEELRAKQAKATSDLLLKFVSDYPKKNKGNEQKGRSSFYPRRKPEDSRLDTEKTISEQFNLLRVSDNERYPAYFVRNGVKYILKIYKA
jgi:methionyl-tRNA formyltransferase